MSLKPDDVLLWQVAPSNKHKRLISSQLNPRTGKFFAFQRTRLTYQIAHSNPVSYFTEKVKYKLLIRANNFRNWVSNYDHNNE